MLDSSNNSLSLGPSATGSIQAGHSSYIYNGSSSSSSPSGIPPPQAFMPSLKILKRPSSATGNKGSTSPNSEAAAAAAAKTMRDREKAYKEARTRIFGEEKAAASSAATSSAENSESEAAIKRPASAARGQMNSNKATSATTLVREPVNPPSATAQSAGGNKTAKDLQREKGFNTARRSKPKKALSAAATEFKPVARSSHSPSPAPAPASKDLDDKMQELKV